MNHSRTRYLQEMGIEQWVLRVPVAPKAEAHTPAAKLTLEQLQAKAADCSACPLHSTRTQVAFARGNPKADIMVIGEAPGFYEDKQGAPFVGKAGKLLDKMLHAVGFTQDDVYIANIIKCRPPDNRDPKADEIKQCSDFIAKQIELVQPKLILALGRFAGQYLIEQPLTLAKMRQSKHEYQSIPVLVSYHPAYLLRNPIDKKKAYQDLLNLRR